MRKLFFKIIGFVGFLITKLLRLTIRIEKVGEEIVEQFYNSNKNYIYAFWHGQLLMMPFSSFRKNRIYVMISESKDGEIIAQVLKWFKAKVVRGSTSHGGLNAMKNMIRKIQEGNDAAITPDGPRGPGYKAQPGIIALAKLSETPIIPLAFGCKNKWCLNSWDRFLIPKPFTKGVFIWGDPIYVPSETSKEDMRKKLNELEEKLNELTLKAENYLRSSQDL